MRLTDFLFCNGASRITINVIMKNSLQIVLILFLSALIGVQLYILKVMHFTTSSISWHSVEEGKTEKKPSPNFKIGNLTFDVEAYSEAKELEPFRQYFEKTCKGLKGIKAASCLSESFVEKVPFGSPSDELFFSSYSPVISFKEHLDGKPGHCVSYSGMEATTLLSVGIPARMVQVLSEAKTGHNIIEVFDEKEGWVIFDPLSDLLLSKDGKPLSALEMIESGASFTKVEAGQDNVTKGYLTEYYDGPTPFDKAITYPEPWLYTRVGAKQSMIFRGSFVAFGRGYWEYGGIQDLTRYGSLFCLLLIALISLSFFKGFYTNLLEKRKRAKSL